MERDALREKTETEQLEKASKTAIGEAVPFTITINRGCEISDVYLKHAANESSEDEEGTENTVEQTEEDQGKEEESFRSFLQRHNVEQTKRRSKSDTSKTCNN